MTVNDYDAIDQAHEQQQLQAEHAHQAMLELEERTEIALRHALDAGTPEDDVRLLCYHAGVQFQRIAQ